MAGFRLISGNRLELLAADLAARLEQRRRDPFRPEPVVVQSRGMERWINMAVADFGGISANLEFPFPRAFIQDYFFAPLLEAEGYEPSAQNRFAVPALTWRIAACLPELISRPEFYPVRRYLEPGAARGLRLYQLSARIADCFDRYTMFRPDVVNAWDAGDNPLKSCPDSRWQMTLWREIVAGLPPVHFAALWTKSRRWLAGESDLFDGRAPDFLRLAALEQVCFFGFSSLAPALMDLIVAASGLIDVNFYYLNPSEEFWEHNLPYAKIIRETGRKLRLLVERAGVRSLPELDVLQAALHFETGNALLGSWGEQGREFFSLIASLDGVEGVELFAGPGDDGDEGSLTLLHRIQRDIRTLRMPEEPEPCLASDDDSVRIHSCHGLMREVEILYDNLVTMFRRRPDLQPGEVLVLTPDIEKYAPYIEAVFRTRSVDDPGWVYATIADRNSLSALPEVRIFFRLLQLDREEYRVSAVLAVLDCEAVRTRFGLDDRDMELVRRWLRDTGVSWGVDAAYRREHARVEFAENSWRQGLDRMLAGLAMSGADRVDPIWNSPAGGELLPYGNIENDAETVLGRLCDFSEKTFALGRRIATLERDGASPEDWRDLLLEAVETFLAEEPEYYDSVSALRTAVGGLVDDLAAGGLEPGCRPTSFRLDLDMVTEALEGRLGERGSGGFLQGGITFCEARPMRSVPARVICLLGMSEDGFPRQEKRLSFDLLPRGPRFGDRSARDDDRYLFLEALLSAREVFYVSYIGQSDRDNAALPPSVLVSELQEYILRYYRNADGTPIDSGSITVRHPLQAFSPRYFRDGSGLLRSWSAENFAVAAAVAGPRPVVSGAGDWRELPEPEEEPGVITLAMLAEFFASPARYFCRHRLGIDLEVRDATMPEDREKFALDALDFYSWSEELIVHHLDRFRTTPDPAFLALLRRRFQAQGGLPPGASGKAEFELFLRDFLPYAADFVRTAGEKLSPVRMMAALPETPVPLYVELNQLFRSQRDGEAGWQLFCRYSRPRERELIRASIYNLALGLPEIRARLEGEGGWQTGYTFKDDKRSVWKVPSDPDAAGRKLAALIGLFRDGMRRPLPFFPDASRELVRALGKHCPEAVLREKVVAAWSERRGNEEVIDPYVAFCFGEEMPGDDDFWRGFRACSLRVDAVLDPEQEVAP